MPGRLYLTRVAVVVLGFASGAALAEPPKLEVWPVDPLVKVFRDGRPLQAGEATTEVARGEHASLQVVARCEKALQGLRATLDPLTPEGGKGGSLAIGSIRFVGYVPVDRPMQTPSKDQLRKVPADYPDPLLERAEIDVEAGQAQPIWLTIPVKTDAEPGLYRGTLKITASADGQSVSASVPVAVIVHKVTVGRSRLWVTNWFQMTSAHMKNKPETDTPAYWDLLRRYARNMAAHRQNAALIAPLSSAAYKVGEGGKLEADFTPFDRWVEIFIQEGVIGRIEGGHIGGRVGGWDSQFVVQIRQVKDGKVTSASVDPKSPGAETFYAWYFPTLLKHLEEKGWLDRYVQHLADEPIPGNIESYRAMAALVRKHAPKLKTIEACHTKDLVGAIDIWVPQLNFYHQDYKHYVQRQKAGDEVWFYTCVFPQGEYANRFIEQPLIKTRLLHWINYRYGATGYLHWGYNWWTDQDPFKMTTRPHGGPEYLPAGDAWIVYPGADGPLDSLRFEAMRDGIADYELLSMLGERDARAAEKLVGTHILAFDRYDCDAATFRATRHALLEQLDKAR
ncbi:MAG TPA: DUF4091 domain-containing protein [Phycisphaerae bacterium]|nr:DUF4091 domain-containing protein [Phycisphaerae bacterium]HRY68239.1 DUF4091 domain-containing protein [Phycisphaerae bacterium]HSA28577.1 DUF4091 domain-containing protein [Phycisphaerae bacterium]